MSSQNTQKQIQEKNINPNPKDLDQRQREIRGRERLRSRRPRQTQAATTQAWVACGLGRPRSRRPRRASLRLGSRAAWGDHAPGVRAPGLGHAQPGFAWVVRSGLKPPTPISIFSPFLFLVFFFFFFSGFFSDVLVVLL